MTTPDVTVDVADLEDAPRPQAELERLREENTQLKADVNELLVDNQVLQRKLAEQQAEINRSRGKR